MRKPLLLYQSLQDLLYKKLGLCIPHFNGSRYNDEVRTMIFGEVELNPEGVA